MQNLIKEKTPKDVVVRIGFFGGYDILTGDSSTESSLTVIASLNDVKQAIRTAERISEALGSRLFIDGVRS